MATFSIAVAKACAIRFVEVQPLLTALRQRPLLRHLLLKLLAALLDGGDQLGAVFVVGVRGFKQGVPARQAVGWHH